MREMDLMKLLQRELKARGIPVLGMTEEGQIALNINGVSATVSLDELNYDFARDADPQLVTRFVSGLVDSSAPLPPWKKARSRLFLFVEPHQEAQDDKVFEQVTDSLRLGVTHADEGESILKAVTESDLRTWQVSRQDAFQAARGNMAGLLEESSLDLRRIGEIAVATFTARSAFKPALVFSPNLKQVVAPKLGWPVLAFLSCREMVYLLEKDGLKGPRDVTAKFLTYMVHEFIESRHSLTTEVLLVSDEGVQVAGVMGVWE